MGFRCDGVRNDIAEDHPLRVREISRNSRSIQYLHIQQRFEVGRHVSVSDETKAFVQSALNRDISKRLNAISAYKDSWFVKSRRGLGKDCQR